jgi:hypothetical protein
VTGHPVEEFWSILSDFTDYPPDVVPVPEQLPGTAAFAASAGLHREPGSHVLPPFPYGGLMIIGHNLDSKDGYDVRRASGISHGDEVPGTPLMSTWRGLYRLLGEAGVDRNEFFFTNVYAGLKEGRPTGEFTAHPAAGFRGWCRDFLRRQVAVMRPRAVLILGVPACRDIANSSTPTPWLPGPLPPPRAVRVRLHGHETVLVPAHHTSMPKRIALDAQALQAAWQGVASDPGLGRSRL